MPELERTLVRHLSETRLEDLQDAAVEAARRCVLDTVAVSVAGSNGQDILRLLHWLEAQGGPEEASVLVHGTRLPARHATCATMICTRHWAGHLRKRQAPCNCSKVD